MQNKKELAAYILIGLVLLACTTAYFVRPREPSVEVVSMKDELPDPNAHYHISTGLAERLSKSYGIALVLVIGEYSRHNAEALEALRSWAHDNFQRNSGFLHLSDAKPVNRAHLSVLDSFCFSLLEAPRMLAREEALQFLKHQIAGFHTTNAYQSFRADYFDSFGLDAESALLLARYESERAHRAIGALMSLGYWSVACALGLFLFFKPHPTPRSTRVQRVLAYFWFSLALFYIVVAWGTNDVAVLVSSLLCLLIGLFLRRPILVSFGEDKGLSFRLVVPSDRVLALAAWTTFSLLAIQVLTWIHTGTLSDPDPVSSLISMLSGDFLHNPLKAKKYILWSTAALWVLFGLLTMWVLYVRQEKSVDERLPALKDSLQ